MDVYQKISIESMAIRTLFIKAALASGLVWDGTTNKTKSVVYDRYLLLNYDKGCITSTDSHHEYRTQTMYRSITISNIIERFAYDTDLDFNITGRELLGILSGCSIAVTGDHRIAENLLNFIGIRDINVSNDFITIGKDLSVKQFDTPNWIPCLEISDISAILSLIRNKNTTESFSISEVVQSDIGSYFDNNGYMFSKAYSTDFGGEAFLVNGICTMEISLRTTSKKMLIDDNLLTLVPRREYGDTLIQGSLTGFLKKNLNNKAAKALYIVHKCKLASADNIRMLHIEENVNPSVSFLPKGKTPEGKNFQTGKIGKVLGKAISQYKDLEVDISYTNKDLEELVNKIKARYLIGGTFKILEGEDIRKWYSEDRHSNRNTGSLERSCMKHDECQDYLDLYVNHTKMLALIDSDDRILGRAILWDDIESLRPKRVINLMDRVYGSDAIIQLFIKWASENGYYRKEFQSYTNQRELVDPDGNLIKLTLTKEIDADVIDKYPYLDTFKFMKGNIITNSNKRKHDYTLDSTRGQRIYDR